MDGGRLTNTVRVGTRVAIVDGATLELFNLFSRRPDWILDARLAGPIPRLWLAGTGEPAPYTTERRLAVAYIDAPSLVTLDGRDGRIAPIEVAPIEVAPIEVAPIDAPGSLRAIEVAPGQARVRGAFTVRWVASGAPVRELAIEVDLVAALVT